jgi:hypothetical protein
LFFMLSKQSRRSKMESAIRSGLETLRRGTEFRNSTTTCRTIHRCSETCLSKST